MSTCQAAVPPVLPIWRKLLFTITLSWTSVHPFLRTQEPKVSTRRNLASDSGLGLQPNIARSHSTMVTTYGSRQLYGGAMTVELPVELIDSR